MNRYSVESFGCRASAADGDGIAAELRELGLDEAAGWREAGVVVVQTCAVTRAAERGARALIRRVGRENPGARVVVTGCYAQRAPEELARLPGVDAVVGNSHQGQAARVAAGLLGAGAVAGAGAGFVAVGAIGQAAGPGWNGVKLSARSADRGRSKAQLWHEPFSACWEGETGLPALVPERRTRPVLKVQDGCGNRCSFCVIPETRGPSRSVGLGEAVEAARRFAEAGGEELVLSGINLGRWGRELKPARTLGELVRALVEETGLPRLRVSSIEPMDWGPELLGLFARYGTGRHPRLAPHAHLPLQSGADAVLRAMHRRYRPWHYAAKLGELRARMPDAALGADVMVGFPGETDDLFEESYRFVAEQPLTYLHVFPFSARPGTRAEHLAGRVRPEVARERMGRMRALDGEKRRRFAERYVGRELSAVRLRDGTALTGNFLAVRLREAGQGPRRAESDPDLGRVEDFAGQGGGASVGELAEGQVLPFAQDGALLSQSGAGLGRGEISVAGDGAFLPEAAAVAGRGKQILRRAQDDFLRGRDDRFAGRDGAVEGDSAEARSSRFAQDDAVLVHGGKRDDIFPAHGWSQDAEPLAPGRSSDNDSPAYGRTPVAHGDGGGRGEMAGERGASRLGRVRIASMRVAADGTVELWGSFDGCD